MRQKIAVTTTSFSELDPAPCLLLEEAGFEIRKNEKGKKLESHSEIVSLSRDCVGIIAGTETYDRKTIEEISGEVRVISRCGVGLDNIDLLAAKDMEIQVFNTPDAPTLAVAELTLGLILSLLRNTFCMDREIRNGNWKKRMGNLLHSKKVGIIGLGRIGRKVAQLLKPYEVDISYFDISEIRNPVDATYKPLNELLDWADIISLHCSSQGPERQILAETEIGKMKPGAWLINVSRGDLIDEDALYNSLKEGRLKGAALDVYASEPYSGPLKELDNVILTPHIGSYAQESRIEMEIQAVQNLIRGLKAI